MALTSIRSSPAIISGDHPDPTILKDGSDYYMTFSSFYYYPGIVIWHSKHLVNWKPIGPALFKPLGSIWAVDLCKHKGRYFVYIPAAPDGNTWSIYVIWADPVEGPWSDPVDLHIQGCIDPGHIVGEDGKRYLFVNGIRKIQLTDDGLATAGKVEPAYSPWRYPDHWVVENFAPEGADSSPMTCSVGDRAMKSKSRSTWPVRPRAACCFSITRKASSDWVLCAAVSRHSNMPRNSRGRRWTGPAPAFAFE